MFSKGVELLEIDTGRLLERTEKRARHIVFRDEARLAEPGVQTLVAAAAARTPRS